MRIILDLQGAQTNANRHRGIGRYSLSLAFAMAKNARDHELWLALNGAFTESILNIRCSFEGIIPQERIRIFNVPPSVSEFNSENAWRIRASEKIREHFIESLQPDVVVVTSLFEGYFEDAVTSIGSFASGAKTAAILYDLIPYNKPEAYLPTKAQRQYYKRKITSLKNAGLIFAISNYSRCEAIEALNLPEDRVVNISSAADPRFKPLNLTQNEMSLFQRRFGITKKPVLCVPGGFDDRKNLHGLFQSYALLPSGLRASHQLVIVGGISDDERVTLINLRKQTGLHENEIVLTGYVNDDDLVMLYNISTLFVFPSKSEGFGLPALEAMACGVPAIGSNVTSIPEVIGFTEALFDPSSPQSIAQKMEKGLTNEIFRQQLRDNVLRQAGKFSWDATARSAISALEALYVQKCEKKAHVKRTSHRPKLAYVSPLPPERSGISDYSAELLPELAHHYDIEVIAAQRAVSDSWIKANCAIRSVPWFQEHAFRFERILYHFGNSPFHSHMFGLLRRFPGTVVLHDFFLSHVLAHGELSGTMPDAWKDALYRSHGYEALRECFRCNDTAKVVWRYPCNLSVLQEAMGVIVHSEYARRLAQEWYGKGVADDWITIPLLRGPVGHIDRKESRNRLKLHDDDFVVCSFGLLWENKLNHRLLRSWLASSLAKNGRNRLIFVGENRKGNYGEELISTIINSGLKKRICITGWVDAATLRLYLSAADVGVQLRTCSRGETSAAILDCMNYGLPTIVNAHGFASELPPDAVWKLPDAFSDNELVEALETLWQDAERRRNLAILGQNMVHKCNRPSLCADRYAEAIESIYKKQETGYRALIKSIADMDNLSRRKSDILLTAESIAVSSMPHPSTRQLLIDVSAIARDDYKTGIQRVVRAQLVELIKNTPLGFWVEPVFLTDEGGEWHYRYARRYARNVLNLGEINYSDEPIDIDQGDVFYCADLFWGGVIEAARSGLYKKWLASGISINFMVYDLLPVVRPDLFPDGAGDSHTRWLKAISESSSRLICISNAVADELRLWLKRNPPIRAFPLIIDVLHLGADIFASAPSRGLPRNAEKIIKAMHETPSFIMIGTIEPRKGHLQTLAAFQQLWNEGHNINLVIVGPEGWEHLPDTQRRNIPQIVSNLRNYKESGKRLFWLEGISDEYLDKVYATATCLIAASEGEGFGLPLIEAAQHKMPIIARDIPVFREVAGEHAFYFKGGEPNDLADAIKDWLALYMDNRHPKSDNLPWLTWKKNTGILKNILLESFKCH